MALAVRLSQAQNLARRRILVPMLQPIRPSLLYPLAAVFFDHQLVGHKELIPRVKLKSVTQQHCYQRSEHALCCNLEVLVDNEGIALQFEEPVSDPCLSQKV
jgi:hypothetical protein